VYVAAGFANYFLPLSAGADVLRAWTLGRRFGDTAGIMASIVAERLLGLIALSVVCLFSLMIAIRSHAQLGILLPWALASIVLGAAIFLAPLLVGSSARFKAWATARGEPGRMQRFARKSLGAYAAYRHEPGVLAGTGVLSVLEQCFPIVGVWLLARALGIPITFPMLVVAMPLVLFAARLPISFGGVGVAEGALVFILGLYGASVTDVAALALFSRLVDVIVVALPGAFLWRELIFPGGTPRPTDVAPE
jgi:hypothetical protein